MALTVDAADHGLPSADTLPENITPHTSTVEATATSALNW